MDEPEPVAHAVERLMRERGWRDTDVTLRSHGHVSPGSLRALIKGRRPNPTVDTMERLADVFDVDPSTFAEYRLAHARRLFDPRDVGLDVALANLSLLVDAFQLRDPAALLEQELAAAARQAPQRGGSTGSAAHVRDGQA